MTCVASVSVAQTMRRRISFTGSYLDAGTSVKRCFESQLRAVPPMVLAKSSREAASTCAESRRDSYQLSFSGSISM